FFKSHQYALSNNVDDIARIESQTYNGLAVIRLYFHPGVSVDAAMAEATASSQAILHMMPQGVMPPIIVRYSANSVSIIQMAISSDTLTGEELVDYAEYRMRESIAVIHGVTIPYPYGGVVRQMMIDLDLEALQVRGLSPRDINQVINNQSIVLPVGDCQNRPARLSPEPQ
ncbi:MAG: efflux RND transporter permease subunit, partial [Chlamydiales bacterium]